MAVILFLKGGAGSGNHGHAGRPGKVGGSAPSDAPTTEPPSSAEISTASEAEAYWREHFAGKTLPLHVKTKTAERPIAVAFDADNSHMWTREAKAGEQPDFYDRKREKAGPRVFERGRAVFMDRIIPTISRPWKVLGSRGRQLFIGQRVSAEQTYIVVLNVRSDGKCEFVSAQPRPKKAVDGFVRDLKPERPGELKKHFAPELEARGAKSAGLQLAGPSGPTPEGVCRQPANGRRIETGSKIAQLAVFFKVAA